MQSYISHPRGTLLYQLINFLLSKSCPIDLFRKISEIIENMIFSFIFVLQKIWYFHKLQKIKKMWYLRWAFLRKSCFSWSATTCHTLLLGLESTLLLGLVVAWKYIFQMQVMFVWARYKSLYIYINTIYVNRNQHSRS